MEATEAKVPRLCVGRVFRLGGMAITYRRDGWYAVGPVTSVLYSAQDKPGAGGLDWFRTRGAAVRTLLMDAQNGIGL